MRITHVSSVERINMGDVQPFPLSSGDDNGSILREHISQNPGMVQETEVDIDPNQSTVTSLDSCLRQTTIGTSNTLMSQTSASKTPDEVSIAEFGRIMHHQTPKIAGTHRLVQKNGDCKIMSYNVMKRKRKYLVDIFTTLVDMRWRYHLLLFAATFLVTWVIFALIWYGIALNHGDDLNHNNASWHSCIDNVYDFRSALLFSIETQHTIGYGYRVIQTECDGAIFVMMLQSCFGLFIQSLITGIIFAKISRPKGRSQTIMFSQKAVICKRDGEYCLLFRVGDMRKSHIIGTSIRALLVKNRLTSEGESIPICQYPLDIETETSHSDSFVFLIWPVTVVHKINSSSPLYDFCPVKLFTEHFEIIVILEGTIESTGMTTQVRTSYIPTEILWGERLVPLMTYEKNGHCQIDYSQFHNTTPVSMPEYSAREFANRQQFNIVLPIESDYPVSFTAPSAGLKPGRRSLYSLFPKRTTSNTMKSRQLAKVKTQQTRQEKSNREHKFRVTSVDSATQLLEVPSAGDYADHGNGSMTSKQQNGNGSLPSKTQLNFVSNPLNGTSHLSSKQELLQQNGKNVKDSKSIN